MKDYILLFIIFILLFFIYNQSTDYFQSYAYPWQQTYGWDWNWYPRWRRSIPGVGWKPGCPSGCRFVGGKERWGCLVPSLEYGNYGCKYDSECKGCDWY